MNFGLQDELDELNYIHTNFKVGSVGDIVVGTHDTILLVYENRFRRLEGFNLFWSTLPRCSFVVKVEFQVVVGGLRYLFKTREQMLSGVLRGYDKKTTIIIGRGGI